MLLTFVYSAILHQVVWSASCTSTQFTVEAQVVHKEVLKAVLPLERPVHIWPDSCTRPVMSSLPSPLKSPTCTSTQVTAGFQVIHRLVLNDEPVERATHHWPVCEYRAAMSA